MIRPIKNVTVPWFTVGPSQNGLLIFFWKTHIPETNHGNRRCFRLEVYNNNGKTWEIVEYFACEAKNIGNLRIFRIFHVFQFSMFFFLSVFQFFLFSFSHVFYFVFSFVFFCVFLSVFFPFSFFFFPFSLLLFFIFQSSEQTPKPEKNSRRFPNVKRTISFCENFDL